MRWIVGLVVLGVLGAGNVLREACWTQADGFVCGPLASRPMAGRRSPTPVTGLTRIDVTVPAWRPLRIGVRLAAHPAAAVRLSDRGDGAGVTIDGGGSVGVLETTAAGDRNRLTLWADRPGGAADTPAAVEIVAIDPVVTPGRAGLALLPGLLAGLLLVWCGTRRGQPAPATPLPVSMAAFAAPAGLLLAVHGAWIVLRPPLQAPDEPQHLTRASSVAATPYVAGEFVVPLAASFRNPITWTPNPLHFIIGKPADQLSADDVAALRATPWRPTGSYPAVEPIPTGIASYPPLYYWSVFAGGELATWLFDLSPYASLLAYRATSVAAAALVWLAVYAVLLATPQLRPWALPGFALLVANPTTAAITATVNPDALAIPTTVLLILATWRRLAEGGSNAWIAIAAALALAVKPSGFLAVAAAGAGIGWWMLRHPADRKRGWASIRALAGVTIASIVLFYAWSPPRLSPVPHEPLSVVAYLGTVVRRAPSLWVEYWGRLGWLEYAAPPACYWLLLAACVALAAAAWRWRTPAGGLVPFLAVAAAAYLAGLAIGEYANHTTASLVLQGRYLLPLSACALPLVRQQARFAAWLLPALLAALHVALAQATVVRYFGGDWSLWWRSVAGG